MKLTSCVFHKSSIEKLNSFPEICLLGKSNVGKSSLINGVFNNSSLAYVSKKPGKTKVLNYFLYNNNRFLVDVPGYGYHLNSKKLDQEFEKIMNAYLTNNASLKYIFLLIDSRRMLTDLDFDLLDFLKTSNFDMNKLIMVATKYDMLNQSEKHKIKIFLQKFKEENLIRDSFFVSAKNKTNLSLITNYLID